ATMLTYRRRNTERRRMPSNNSNHGNMRATVSTAHSGRMRYESIDMANTSHGCRSLLYAAYGKTAASRIRRMTRSARRIEWLEPLVTQELIDEALENGIANRAADGVYANPVSD